MNGKIPIFPERIYELTNSKNREIERLLDDRTPQRILLSTGLVISPFEVWYEFPTDQNVTLERIELVDGQGSQTTPTNISVISKSATQGAAPWVRTSIYDFTGPLFNQTTSYTLPIPIQVKYLVITVANYFVPDKLRLFGIYNENYVNTVAVLPFSKKFKEYIGINNFTWDSVDDWQGPTINETKWAKQAYFHNIRHYLDWKDIQPTVDKLELQGKRDLFAIYSRMKSEGKIVTLCLKTLPDFISKTYPKVDAENIPVDSYGLSLSSPSSYLLEAKVFTYLAAAFGRNAVNKSIFDGKITEGPYFGTSGPVVTASTGTDLVNYLEIENERDKWWKNPARYAYQTAREYAANMSACYDGHKGTMGSNIGIKVIDPTMKVVIGGTAFSKLDYLRGIVDWCREYRGYKTNGKINLCFDVINYHIYANTGGNVQYGSTAKKGLNPEEAGLYEQQIQYLQYIQDIGENLEIFITETGYDNHPDSPQAPMAITGVSNERVVADWTVRTSLVYSRSRLDKLMYYMLDDAGHTFTAGQYATPGFKNEDGTFRLNGKWMQQMNTLLGEYSYHSTINTGTFELDKYTNGGLSRYVAWKPTRNNSTATYNSNETYTTYTLTDTGTHTEKGLTSFTISETPIVFDIENGQTTTTPDAPTIVADDTTNTLSASHVLGTSEILVSVNNGAYTNYTTSISVGNVNRPIGYWKFKVRAATGRNESLAVTSPAFTIANTTPAAPTITADNTNNTLSASHSLGNSEIVVSENNGVYTPYSGIITVGNVDRAAGYWKFKIKASTGRNESVEALSPAFTVVELPNKVLNVTSLVFSGQVTFVANGITYTINVN